MEPGQNEDTSNKNLWGPVDLTYWLRTPHIKNELAIEQDVKDGRAVFYINGKGQEHKSLDIPIPSIAYHIDNETTERTLVIVIQGEKVDEEDVIGIRYLDGGNGICLLWELDFVKNPDKIVGDK